MSRLDTICGAYGKGEEAVSSRSIRVEDVNRVTGYNPETAEYQKGQADEYGNEVTCWWTGIENPYYTSTNGSKGDLEHYDGKFSYFNGTEYITSTAPETATESAPVKITTLTLDYYEYYGTTLTDSSNDEVKGLAVNSKAYIMLFSSRYWLASTYIGGLRRLIKIELGMRLVEAGQVKGAYLVYSSGGSAQYNFGVRAVVSLDRDIDLRGSSESGWEII